MNNLEKLLLDFISVNGANLFLILMTRDKRRADDCHLASACILTFVKL